jgi:hypothetical protein
MASTLSTERIGLVCPMGSADAGHVLLPNGNGGYGCAAPGCEEALSDGEARVGATRQMFGVLHGHYTRGRLRLGCRACAEAEEAASLVLAPGHSEWLPWIMSSMALAGAARDTRLLVAAFSRRQAMRAAEPSGLDVFLHLHRAIALGLGSAAATESIRSAFGAARALRDCDVRHL